MQKIASKFRVWKSIYCGVPQEMILGPLFFFSILSCTICSWFILCEMRYFVGKNALYRCVAANSGLRRPGSNWDYSCIVSWYKGGINGIHDIKESNVSSSC